jgi:hypothetical protein
LKVLVIQAENDEGDLAEQRNGVMHVIQARHLEIAAGNLSFVTMPDAAGQAFADRLESLCLVHGPDVVFIDPVFSFLGGDNSAQKDVSHFVRNLILPVLMRHKCAAIMMHHVNKPQKDAAKSGAYHMAGSAEWANAARCALSLEAVADGVFRMEATKRGDRLRWVDDAGFKTKAMHLAHHGGHTEDGSPIIAWRMADPSEVPSEASSAGKKATVKDVVRSMRPGESLKAAELISNVMSKCECGKNTARARIDEAVELGVINALKLGKCVLYNLP